MNWRYRGLSRPLSAGAQSELLVELVRQLVVAGLVENPLDWSCVDPERVQFAAEADVEVAVGVGAEVGRCIAAVGQGSVVVGHN